MIISFIDKEHICRVHFRYKFTGNTDKLIQYVKGIQYSLDSYFLIDGGRSSEPAGRSSGPAGRSSGPAGRSSEPAAELFSCETIVFTSLTVAETSVIQF